MKVVQKKIADLKPQELNIRRHTESQIKEYVRSLEMFDQIRPIVVDEQNNIIAGNGMYDALVRMGREKADCFVVTGLTEVQKKKMMLADNKVYELGITDMDAFDKIIKELGNDFDVPGWDEDLLKMLNSSVTEVTDSINNYGTFDKEEVQNINSKAEGKPNVIAATAGESAPSDMAEASEQRFIICPKCGEKICLSDD